MKPTKNRFFCNDCAKVKMQFETEKKANTFIKFNENEIEEETGFKPIRSYYCISCDCWHVTSKIKTIEIKSKTEVVLEKYREEVKNEKQNQKNIENHTETLPKEQKMR